MVRRGTRQITLMLLATAVFFFVCIQSAYATGGGNDDDCRGHSCNEMDQRQDQDQGQHQGQEQDQHQDQDQGQDQTQSLENANTLNVETAAAGGAANNEGNQQNIEISSNYEGGPADLVLVPNNNTERCLRVFGFSFGNTDGSGMLGLPFRSAQCDYGQFASAADAQGNLELGWYWRCHMKSAYRTFKDKGEKAETAISQCHDRMIGAVGMVRTIETLREQLTASEELRQIERNRHENLTEELSEQCEESKDRIAAACVRGK